MPERSPIDLSAELTAAERTTIGSTDSMAQRMATYVSPTPSANDTARLLAHLRPLVAARATPAGSSSMPSAASAGAQFRHWIRLAWSQTTLVEPPFWWASSAIFIVGLIAGLVTSSSVLSLAFMLLSPVLAASGVAFIFRPAGRTLRELEQASPIHPLELVYARLGLILTFNLVTSICLLMVAWSQEPRFALWRMIILWIGPMVGMAGIALYATARWGAVTGAAIPLCIWSAMVAVGWQWVVGGTAIPIHTQASEVLSLLGLANGALAAAVLLLVAGLTLLVRGGRLAVGDDLGWN